MSTSIAEVCIKRPVFATVLTLITMLIGCVFYNRLPVKEYPNIENPIITVESTYNGASPQVIENQISKILEGQFATIPGVESITSNSTTEKSEITIEFSPERDIDSASSDVRDRISLVKAQLPREIHDPIIRKSDNSASAGIFLVFSSDKMKTDELYDYVDRYIKPKFEMLQGVASVHVGGGDVKTMRVFIDPHKLASVGHTPADVVEALGNQHVERPLGRVIGKDREYMIIGNCELNTPQQFDEVTINSKSGSSQVVKVKNIGHTEFVNEEKRRGVFFNGREGVSISITKQSIANPINLSNEVKKIIPEVKDLLPRDVDVIIAMDEAETIQASMDNVFHAIFEAVFLVILVVFFFLWSPKATLIPIVTIPVSLIGTFALLYACGFSINIMTLLAMVLAVGLVVDDAIVVLENVYRHMEKGKSRIEAAIDASKEIMFAIIAMTLTLATAYIPLTLTPGRMGRMLTEFAVALAGSVLISGFVALTLSPMMCSKFLTLDDTNSEKFRSGTALALFEIQKKFLKNVDSFYSRILDFSFAKKWLVLGGAACVIILGGASLYFLPSEDFPNEDRGYVSVRGETPIGATYSYVEKNAIKMDEIMKTIPDAKLRYIEANTNEISGFISLNDWKDRKHSSQELAGILNDKLKEISGVLATAYTFSGSGNDNSLQFVLQTNQGYPYLEKYGHYFPYMIGMNYPGMSQGLRSTLLPPQQEYIVDVDREKASTVGVTAYDVLAAIETSIKGTKAGNVQRESYRDELFVQLDQKNRETIDILKDIYVKGQITEDKKSYDDVRMIPVTDLINVKTRLSPTGLYHNNKMLAASFTLQLAPGYPLGKAVNQLKELKEKTLPDTIVMSFTGSTKTYIEDGQKMVVVMLLAIMFVFLVLAAQFESFWDPLIIMLTVPLAITGALVLLYVVPEGTLNIYSKIGLVTLVGLITKHGILIVDFANKLKETGFNSVEAVKRAAYIRLRPILMTTFAMVLGAVPLVFASGAGSAARRQIGYAIIGGMSFGTLFTLFMLPLFYVIFIDFKEKFIYSWIGSRKI